MKEIPLTQGKVAIVDDDMYEYLSQWKWSYSTLGYAVRSMRVRKLNKAILMHRVIMNAPDGFEVDHIEPLHKLDNRRSNLRVCTHAENMRNMPITKRNTSGYIGVYWHKRAKKWMAYVTKGDKHNYLGLFESAEEAARVRDAKAKELFGKFARTNF